MVCLVLSLHRTSRETALGGKLRTAREWGEQLLTLAQNSQDPAFFVLAHRALGATLFLLGDLAPARAHLEQSITLYDSQSHRYDDVLYGQAPGVFGRSYLAWILWSLGYPDQALEKIHEAFTLAQELANPNNLVTALIVAATLHQYRREGQATQERAEALIAGSTEYGIATLLAWGAILRGWALAEQGQTGEVIAQIHEGVAVASAATAGLQRPYYLALLAEAYEKAGQTEEGLNALAEALATADKTGERHYEAEMYRLKGQLTLQKFQVSSSKFQVDNLQSAVRNPQSEAEECFWRAIEIARRQSAKSLELRAVMSLSRLWQQQDKKAEAREMLAEIYGWFTEGFDTADLKEAKTLLEELSH